jgi:hypothetical protein
MVFVTVVDTCEMDMVGILSTSLAIMVFSTICVNVVVTVSVSAHMLFILRYDQHHCLPR